MDEGRPPERPATLESVSSTANTVLIVVVLTFVMMVITLALVIWLLVRSFQNPLIQSVNVSASAAAVPSNLTNPNVAPPLSAANGTNKSASTGTVGTTKQYEPAAAFVTLQSSMPTHEARRFASTQPPTTPTPVDNLPVLPADPCKDHYLILLKVDAPLVVGVAASNDPAQTEKLVDTLARQYHLTVDHIYHYIYMGFSATMTSQLAQAMSADQHVSQVIADQLYLKCPAGAAANNARTKKPKSIVPAGSRRTTALSAPKTVAAVPRRAVPAKSELVHAHVKHQFDRRFSSAAVPRSTTTTFAAAAHAPAVNVTAPAPASALYQKSTTRLYPPRPWGLDRIGAYTDESRAPIDVDVSVFDTGVDPFSANIEVVDHQSFVHWEADAYDYDGHGTHIAGIVAGLGVGVAPGARIRNIKVLDRHGRGTLSSVLAGLDYEVGRFVDQQASRTSKSAPPVPPTVLNLSFGADFHDPQLNIFDDALVEAQALGLHVVTAAGNSRRGTTTFSPARTPGVFSAAAYDESNTLAVWSSSSEDSLNAPGVNILSFLPNNKTSILSGSSQAAAHISGIVARYVARHPTSTTVQVRNALVQISMSVGTVSNPRIDKVPAGSSILSIYDDGFT